MNARLSLRTAVLMTMLMVMACGAARAAAIDEPISTDRPDFVESSLTVGKGVVQIETSVALERREGFGRQPQQIATPSLLRVGFAEAWEARVETDGSLHQYSEPGTPQVDGLGDLSLGLKYHIATPGPAGASSALLLHVDIPTGSVAFRGNGYRPSLRYVAEWELPWECDLGVMPGIAMNEDDRGQHYVSGIAGVTVAHSWTETFRSFVELAGEELGSAGHSSTRFTFDTGLAWIVTRNLQLDAAAYIGLNRSTPDITLAIGISSRW